MLFTNCCEFGSIKRGCCCCCCVSGVLFDDDVSSVEDATEDVADATEDVATEDDDDDAGASLGVAATVGGLKSLFSTPQSTLFLEVVPDSCPGRNDISCPTIGDTLFDFDVKLSTNRASITRILMLVRAIIAKRIESIMFVFFKMCLFVKFLIYFFKIKEFFVKFNRFFFKKMSSVFIIQTYKNTSKLLKGAESDYSNLFDLSQHLLSRNIWQNVYFAVDTNKQDVINVLRQPSDLIWMSGHGILYDNNQNLYLMEDGLLAQQYSNNIFHPELHIDSEEFKWAVHQNLQPLSVYIMDFCHASSLFNLKYYYEDTGTWAKKVLNQFPDKWDDSPSKTCIVIAGASDYESAYESNQGGFLTNYLMSLLKNYGYVTLELFIKNKPKKIRSVITTNKIISPELKIISL